MEEQRVNDSGTDGGTGGDFRNNIVTNCSSGLYVTTAHAATPSATLANSDFNDWFNLIGSNSLIYQDSFYTYAQWRTATGFDGSSMTTNPGLTATFTPTSGSPIKGAGVNLIGLGISALNADKAGFARSPIGPWSMGAYELSSQTVINPPTLLTAIVR